MIAQILWSQWHEALLPPAFYEEACDTLLSRVVHRLACNAGATTCQQCFDENLLVAPTSTEEHDGLLSGIPAGTLPHIETLMHSNTHKMLCHLHAAARTR